MRVAADPTEVAVACRPGGDGERGGAGGKGGQERLNVRDIPRDGIGFGARARFGNHAGRNVARRNGVVRKARGKLEGSESGSAAEVEDGSVWQILGKRIEQAEGGALQVD